MSYYDRGMACLREGRFQEARPLFEAATRLTPDSADSWKALGLTLLRLNDYGAAAEPLRHACELGPAGEDSCYLEGRVLFVLSRYDESIAPLEKALRNSGQEDRAKIERALALACDKLGNSTEAERWFIAAIDHYRDAKSEDPRLDYGAFLVRQGRAGEAIKPLALALGANPNSFAGNVENGRALLDMDRPADALPFLERAAAINASSSNAQMLLGKTLLRMGRTEEGERILREGRKRWDAANGDARKRWDAANQGSSSVK